MALWRDVLKVDASSVELRLIRSNPVLRIFVHESEIISLVAAAEDFAVAVRVEGQLSRVFDHGTGLSLRIDFD